MAFLTSSALLLTSFFIYGRNLGLLDLGPFCPSRDDLVFSDVSRAPCGTPLIFIDWMRVSASSSPAQNCSVTLLLVVGKTVLLGAKKVSDRFDFFGGRHCQVVGDQPLTW